MSDDPLPHSPGRILDLLKMTRGGVVHDAAIAQRLGELLLEAHYGKEELARQRPLIITDKGDYWQVDGSWNRDRKIEGKGAFFMCVQKYDGRVMDFGIWGVIHPDPSAKAIIEAQMRDKKRGGRD